MDTSQTSLWQSGEDGYHTYRIPALAVTAGGSVLAFCEGRRHSASDSGEVDMLVKRSTNGAGAWSDQQVVRRSENSTCGNPSPVVDKETGTVWLLMTWNRADDNESEIIDRTSKDSRRVFVTFSADDGVSWAPPEEITPEVKKPDWTWYATGPGAGIQIEHGAHAGRLVIPCDHIEAGTKHHYSHVIYSDDHGETWQLGGRTPQHQVNECEVVELTAGRLMLNMRNHDATRKHRQVACSDDGGVTWQNQHTDELLVEPICQASIRRYAWPQDRAGAILFSNPASSSGRRKMTVRASFDEGLTWPARKILHEGPSAYSDLAILPDKTIACLYESGEKHPYERITLSLFDLASIEMNQERRS